MPCKFIDSADNHTGEGGRGYLRRASDSCRERIANPRLAFSFTMAYKAPALSLAVTALHCRSGSSPSLSRERFERWRSVRIK